MKRSAPLTRKTPLKPGKPMARTSAIERSVKSPKGKLAPAIKAMKSRQRSVSPAEKLLWDRLAGEIGCVACMKDGRFNPHVSIHHVDGRTKPGCHALVLPLCGPHHQHVDDDPLGRIGVHPWKARFEERYGDQRELVRLCMGILDQEAGA